MASIRKRTKKDGSASYRVEIRLKGFPSQRATFSRLTDAKRWTQQTESAIREGRYFKTSEAQRHTAAQLVDRYIADVLPTKPKQAYTQTQQLKWWKSEIGDYVLGDVTPALIAEKRDQLLNEQTKRKTKRSPATTNRYLAALSHAFSIAVKEWGWLEDNPVRKVRKPTEPKGRVRFLSDDERMRLLETSAKSDSPFLYLVVVLALSTGMRRGEIMGLKWADVDFQRGCVTLHQTKNGEVRVVPIAGHALDELKRHAKVRRLDTDLLFPGKVKQSVPVDITKPWRTALTRASIEDFKFHDLRHSAASYLAMNGASIAEIAEVLGHKTLQMVKRYSHFSESHTANVVGRMNKKIFGDL